MDRRYIVKLDIKGSLQKGGTTIKKFAEDVITKHQEKKESKTYIPVMKEEFKKKDYVIPKIIMLTDEVKSGEDFRDAIGWVSNDKECEFLYLTRGFVDKSGITFIPAPMPDTMYYVDPFDNSRYIKIEDYFIKTQQAKIAELTHIAECLGAKSYDIQIVDASNKNESNNGGIDVKEARYGSANANFSNELTNSVVNSTRTTGDFVKVKRVRRPDLCWFKNDDIINNLVEAICKKKMKYQTFDVEILGSTYNSMSVNTALKLNGLVSYFKLNCNVDFSRKVKDEMEHKMILHMEFE